MFKYVCFGLAIAALAVAQDQQNLDCIKKNSGLLPCLTVKAISAIDRASRSAKIDIIDGISVVRTTPLERTSRAMGSETQMLESLPEGTTDKALTLAGKLFDSAVNFAKTHSIKARNLDLLTAAFDSHLPDDDDDKNTTGTVQLNWAYGLAKFITRLAPVLYWVLTAVIGKIMLLGKGALLVGAFLLAQKFILPLLDFNRRPIYQAPSVVAYDPNTYYNYNTEDLNKSAYSAQQQQPLKH